MINYWAGDEAGFEAVLQAQTKANEMIARGDTPKDLEDMVMPLYERHGKVGVVTIKGPLVAGDAGFMRLFGIVGYDNIRSAMLDALNDSKAESILLSIDSGGGDVNGVSDTSKFIRSIANIKPVTAYADNAASAAYWLGSAATNITAAETGILGSIGVLRVHTEYSKADEKAGVTRTILRKGKYKALINPIEPLTDVAKEQADAMLDEIYKSFVTRVAEHRGVSYAQADSKMAQGREFLGTKSVEVGLADKVGTFEDALTHAASLGNGDKQRNSATTNVAKASLDDNNTSNREGIEVKPTLTAEQLAAAAGVGVVAPTATTELEQAAATAAAATAAAAAVETDATKAELSTTIETLTATKAELATVQQQLVEAQATIDAGKQAAIDAGETITALSAIVSAYTCNMVIALGGKADEVKALDVKALVAKHEETSTSFKSKFKAGGVAAPSPVEKKDGTSEVTKPQVSPLFAAMVKNVTAK